MAIRMTFSRSGIFTSTLPNKQVIIKNRRQLHMKTKRSNTTIMSSMIFQDSNVAPDPTPSDTIKQFYKCINEKNVKQLENYISNDCLFEDYSFPKPFKGKKEVIRFLKQLTAGMGQNVEFHINHIFEGDDDLIVGASWHLEWRNKHVPFSRGCSLYRLTIEREGLTIRIAQVFVESPIKPGDLYLVLLKIVTSVFDAFPEATEWFFRSQHVIVKVLLKIYSMFLVPFITPMVTVYVNLGNLVVRFVSIAFKTLEWWFRLFRRYN